MRLSVTRLKNSSEELMELQEERKQLKLRKKMLKAPRKFTAKKLAEAFATVSPGHSDASRWPLWDICEC